MQSFRSRVFTIHRYLLIRSVDVIPPKLDDFIASRENMLPVYLASPYNATYCCQIKLLELTMLYIPKQYNFLSILSVCFKCYNFVYMEHKQCFCLYFRITKDFEKCLFYSMYSLCYPVILLSNVQFLLFFEHCKAIA